MSLSVRVVSIDYMVILLVNCANQAKQAIRRLQPKLKEEERSQPWILGPPSEIRSETLDQPLIDPAEFRTAGADQLTPTSTPTPTSTI